MPIVSYWKTEVGMNSGWLGFMVLQEGLNIFLLFKKNVTISVFYFCFFTIQNNFCLSLYHFLSYNKSTFSANNVHFMKFNNIHF